MATVEVSPRTQSTGRFRFSLKGLLLVVVAACLCAFIARLSGWIEALGVGIAIVLAGVASRLRGVSYATHVRWFSAILSVLIVWAVGVDRSVFREGCEHCGSHWFVLEYRVFGHAVSSQRFADHRPTLRLIAEDLGAPCPHQYTRWHKLRMWGFVFAANPAHSGTCCLGDSDWYENRLRATVRFLGRQDPNLGPEFRSRVLLNHDYAYLQTFYADLHAAANPPAESLDECDCR